MFKALGEEEIAIVVDAMEEKRFGANETVIVEGEPGQVLYVLEEGSLDCYKKTKPGVSIITFIILQKECNNCTNIPLLVYFSRMSKLILRHISQEKLLESLPYFIMHQEQPQSLPRQMSFSGS